jgi:hypothetical protein
VPLLKQVNYIIHPNSARPAKIRYAAHSEVYDFDLDQVEMAALRETLQTTLGANPFSSFIRAFLASYTDSLVWLGEGPGIGREMRRAFSALFGRFFARAYLSDCHGFVWFAPLDGRVQRVAPRLRVAPSGPHQNLPDWICAGQRHLALAEAKGARGTTRLTYQSKPAPIRQAIKQLQNCRVSVFDRARQDWIERRLKGWAVFNQWCIQSSNAVYPFLYVVDPVTHGEELADNDLPMLIRAVAREHVAGLFRGLRLYSLANSMSSSLFELSGYAEVTFRLSARPVSPVTVRIPSLGDVTATGRFFSTDAGDLTTAIFGEEIFIGVQTEVIEDLSGPSDGLPPVIVPRSVEGAVQGADGLIVARHSAVTAATEG